MRIARFTAALALILPALSLTAASPAAAAVAVTTVSYSGTGCPTGTAQSSISSDGKTLQVSFSQLVAVSSLGVPTNGFKSCTLRIRLAGSPSDSLNATATLSGVRNLPPGRRATSTATYASPSLPDLPIYSTTGDSPGGPYTDTHSLQSALPLGNILLEARLDTFLRPLTGRQNAFSSINSFTLHIN
ncbi:DUF4360 domain-containing protein [Streptomyces sp. NPDC058892]|uniref:DUF4360 domain-containing protein n=1 Tax=unclassified Streptomyces TaxID=2593676 RepID=UPI0036B404D6